MHGVGLRFIANPNVVLLQFCPSWKSIPPVAMLETGNEGPAYPCRPLWSSLRTRICKRERTAMFINAIPGESPYEILGVSPFAGPHEIKMAYRQLVLKYHPDVNKQTNAMEVFLRVKRAYTELMTTKTREGLKSGENSYTSSFSNARSKPPESKLDEEFYGFGDFFRDVQREFKRWEVNGGAQQEKRPKGLWEELYEMGEQFVGYLEKNIGAKEGEQEQL